MAPIRPAMPPPVTINRVTIRGTSTPAYSVNRRLCPVSRTS